MAKDWAYSKHSVEGHRLVLLLMAIISVFSTIITVYLTINQAKLSGRIADLELKQSTLFNLVKSRQNDPVSGPLRGRYHLSKTTTSESILPDLEQVDVNPSQGLVDKRRSKREVTSPRSEKRREKGKKKKPKKSKLRGAHFRAYVDHDRLARELAEGKNPTAGNFTKYGFQLNDRIYNIWKPEEWSNEKLFRYNSTSGKVKVMSTGVYLVYAQILFHSPYFRKSFGIHINDETKPYIEALSFGSTTHGVRRYKRRAELLDPDPYADLYAADQHRIRHRRSEYLEYSQCNTMAIAYIKKNDQVFLKSLESKRSVIPKEYLTFWGLVKL